MELCMAYDFWITAVKTNDQHITYVRVRRNYPTILGAERTVARGFVADLINIGKATFCTSVKNAEGKWTQGAHVHVLDDEFLTTDPNSKLKDNLGKLPEF